MAKDPKPTTKKAPRKRKSKKQAPVELAQQPSDTTVEATPTAPEVALDHEATQAESPTEEVVADKPIPVASVLENQFKPTSLSRRRQWGKRLMISGFILLTLATGVRWYIRTHPDSGTSTAQNKALVAEVSKRVVLPTGESPSITTVVNKDKVSQSFLANATNGDKVLLYFEAGKAIVYRPSTHQVVNIGPLKQPPAKVFLRNGSTANTIPSSISDKLNNPIAYTIISADTSAKRDYAKTLVVDVTGNRPDVATRVAKLIGAEVGELPNGESPPDADILIIVGADTK